jgi:hypothetical protein
VLNLLLKQSNLDVTMQRRIAGHGIAKRDFPLLAQLAAHPALDPEVDTMLSKINSAVVKTAWVSRPGRTPEEITQMVRTEKRVTVLSALAQSEGLPEELYRSIIERTDSVTILSVLHANAALPARIRELAALKKIASAPAVTNDDHGLEGQRAEVMRSAINSVPQIISELLDSNDLYVLYALASHTHLPCEVQLRTAKRFEDRYSTTMASKTRYDYYQNPWQNLIDLTNTLIEQGPVCTDAAAILDNMLEQVGKQLSQGWFQSRIMEAKDALSRSGTEGVKTLQSSFANVDSVDAMTEFVEETDKVYHSGKFNFPESALLRIAVQIIGSPYAKPATIETVAGWYNWGDSTKDAFAAAGRDDAERIAALIIGFTSAHCDVDEVLSEIDCADAVMRLLIEQEVRDNARSRRSYSALLTSKHFKPEMVKLFPLDSLVSMDLDPTINDAILGDLSDVLMNDESWNFFVTLAEEFEGPLENLITVCRSL